MSITPTQSPSPAGRRGLKRAITACHDEILALNWALGGFEGVEAARLRAQSERRELFLRDLDGVAGLGRSPRRGASLAARLRSGLRTVKRWVSGPHAGDAYAACARATGATADTYSAALRTDLRADIRLGLERQYREIESDRKQLARLRWGALPLQVATQGAPQLMDSANRRSASADREALESWSDDGGTGENRSRDATRDEAGRVVTTARPARLATP